MNDHPGWLALLAVATAVDGLLAGASLDQSIKQLPARHRLGMRAFAAYSQASDLARGLPWYALLGAGGALLTVAAAVGALALAPGGGRVPPLLIAGTLAIAHSLVTARAAPLNWSQRAAGGDEAALARIFRRFARWQMVRSTLQLATFLTMVWALLDGAPA